MCLGNYQFFLREKCYEVVTLYIKLLPSDQVYFISNINKMAFPSAEWPTASNASDVPTQVTGTAHVGKLISVTAEGFGFFKQPRQLLRRVELLPPPWESYKALCSLNQTEPHDPKAQVCI